MLWRTLRGERGERLARRLHHLPTGPPTCLRTDLPTSLPACLVGLLPSSQRCPAATIRICVFTISGENLHPSVTDRCECFLRFGERLPSTHVIIGVHSRGVLPPILCCHGTGFSRFSVRSPLPPPGIPAGSGVRSRGVLPPILCGQAKGFCAEDPPTFLDSAEMHDRACVSCSMRSPRGVRSPLARSPPSHSVWPG